MKVKRFNNLWTMGLIIFGALLVGFYALKIICPSFVVGVAEMPSVVKFGNFVDSHWWAYYIFNFIVSFLTSYIYCCACLKTKRLKMIELIFISFFVIFLFFFQYFMPQHYLGVNVLVLFAMPTTMHFFRKEKDKTIIFSTTITASIHYINQILSLEIRDISTMIRYPNSATFSILLIDGFICLFLLYGYFNFKEEKRNG